MNPRTRLIICTWSFAAAALLAACGSSSKQVDASSGGGALVGTFHLTAGVCTAGAPTGSYFRMITPGGSIQNGKFFDNPDSKCANKSYTLVRSGAAGGFVAGQYQPNPVPAFDASGNALANSIIAPQSFTGINFSLSTSSKDPQSGRSVKAPSIIDKNGSLSGQVTAWSAAWNHQYFNQGSPKPDGSSPGLTSPVTGTYDATTHAFVITWASKVVGGPFNGFSGYWHLQGTFTPST